MFSKLLKPVCFFLTAFLVLSQTDEHGNLEGWSYVDEANWNETYADCGGCNQSPIDIKTADVIQEDSKAVTWSGWDVVYPNVTVEHFTDKITAGLIANKMEAKITLDNNTYQMSMILYLWGSDSSKGSEHSVDGHFYAGECQIILYNTKYNDAEEATYKDDGFATILFFLNENEDLPEDIALVEAYKEILAKLAIEGYMTFEINTNTFAPGEMLPKDKSAYRYKGSKPFPPCTENVEWVVLKTPLDVTPSLMELFRALNKDTGNVDKDSIRSIQDNKAIKVFDA